MLMAAKAHSDKRHLPGLSARALVLEEERLRQELDRMAKRESR